MKSNNSRIDDLKEMISLEEKRAALQQQLDSLSGQLSQLKDRLFSGSPAAAAPQAKAKPAAAPAASAAPGKFAAGSLKDKVMAALQGAGDQGVFVKDLAAAIGTKPVNIHSWFHSNLERNPSIEKLTGGHYRLKGNGTAAAAPATKRGPKAAGKKPGRKAAKPAPSGSKRGALSASILGELQAAGRKGVSVSGLSEKLGKNYKNIYIWFSTTGKKNPKIQKVGKAAYRLVD